jgi:hypothetical protein
MGIVSTCVWVVRVQACVEGWVCIQCVRVLDGTCVGVSRSKGISKCEVVDGNYLPDRCPTSHLGAREIRGDVAFGNGRG